MSTLTISLPESMKDFVDSQVSSGGFGSPDEYLRVLIQQAQIEKERAEIDAKLLEGIDALQEGQGREMTVADWDRLRARVRGQ